MRALIVDPSDGRASLAGLRALAAAGWTVGIGSPRRRTLAGSSRWCAAWDPVPALDAGEDEFVGAINRAVNTRGYELVFATSDGEVLGLSRLRDGLAAQVPYAPDDRVVRALDKLALGSAAETAGLATPATAVAGTEDAARLAERPVVIKERVHGALAAAGGPARVEAKVCRTPAEAGAWVARLGAGPAGGQALVQELLSGSLVAFSVVTDREAGVLCRLQQRAERTWPATAGCSVRARTVPIDEALAARVSALMRELQWFGLAQLQFIDTGEGQPRLIDFNGRFYGSLSLALAAGVNLPATWAALATGTPAERADARPGVRYHYLEGDLQVARSERRGGLLRDVGGCLRYALGAQHSILSLRDPGPGLRGASMLAGEAGQAARRRLHRRRPRVVGGTARQAPDKG